MHWPLALLLAAGLQPRGDGYKILDVTKRPQCVIHHRFGDTVADDNHGIIALSLALVTPHARQKPQELPLPAALKAARTAYVVNGGVIDRVMGWTIRDLRNWGRWELVADSEASDITITITRTPPNPYGSYQLVMTITSTATKVQLYGVSYTSGPLKELKQLQKRLEAEK